MNNIYFKTELNLKLNCLKLNSLFPRCSIQDTVRKKPSKLCFNVFRWENVMSWLEDSISQGKSSSQSCPSRLFLITEKKGNFLPSYTLSDHSCNFSLVFLKKVNFLPSYTSTVTFFLSKEAFHSFIKYKYIRQMHK